MDSDYAICEDVEVRSSFGETFNIHENMCYGRKEATHTANENKCEGKFYYKCYSIMVFVIVFALLLGTAGACVAFALQIVTLKSEIESLQMASDSLSQQNESIHTLYQQLSQQNESINTLHQQLSQQNELLNSSTQLLLSVLEGPVGNFPFHPAVSCAALPLSSPSSYYWVRASNGSAVRVYCDMSLSCGGVTGGWMRVAELDMTNSSHQCPSGLMEHIYSSGNRTCRIDSTSEAICSSVVFPINDLRYSQVCGKIIAYQFASPDGFGGGSRGNAITIDKNYVDGISLTHGNPRHHIWTFAAARDELGSACPCVSSNSISFSSPPAFVGEDYFCDTASADDWEYTFYVDDPLWDGAGCGPLNTCCSFNTPPWFHKQLPQPTTDDIEMRVCRDQWSGDEDVAIETIDIHIQ